jgi:hypothetical protein
MHRKGSGSIYALLATRYFLGDATPSSRGSKGRSNQLSSQCDFVIIICLPLFSLLTSVQHFTPAFV